MEKIDTSAENFKTSPLGFLMSVLAKYQAYMNKARENSGDKEAEKKAAAAKEMLDNLKIELSKIQDLQKEPSNEAVLVHVIEACDREERETILSCVFEYHSLLDNVIQGTDGSSVQGQEALAEYYDVSRLGLILNCYLGEFSNDDYFYGTLADVVQTVQTVSDVEKLKDLCSFIEEKIEKADINLAFRAFLRGLYDSFQPEDRLAVYEKILLPYAESLLNKVLKERVGEEEINRLACAKQIQRIYEKLQVKA